MIKSLVNHFEKFSQWIYNKYSNVSLKIVEIGCNDGVLLHPLKKLGYKNLIGIDPSQTIKKIDSDIITYNDYFADNIVDDILIQLSCAFVTIITSPKFIRCLNNSCNSISKVLK